MSEVTDIDAVAIDEPAHRSMERHPSDLLRLAVALVATGVGFLLATVFNDVAVAVTVEVIELAGHLPTGVVIAGIVVVLLVGLLIPLVAVGRLALRGRWRRLALGLVAVAAAVGVVWLVDAELVRRFGGPEMTFRPAPWVCTGALGAGGDACVPGDTNAHVYFIAGWVALFSSMIPWLSKRWRRFGWAAITTLVAVRMIQGTTPPLDELLVVGLAYAVGAAVLLVFGAPDRRPRGDAIARALHRSGLGITELRRADVDARGSTPYFAKTADGRRLFVKVLTPEERAADVMFRVVRMFRLKGVGDERPFSSLKRAVEHEAVGSLKAASDGVRTPRLEAIAGIEPDSMLMAYAMIDGSSLDGVDAEELTDDVLAGIWSRVALLRRRRTAHRDLRLANVFLDDDGVPWLIDFGFAELAATDGQLRSDVAELVTSTSLVVGPERAVAAAIDGIGPDAVAEAASRIQPLALSGATREAMKRRDGLDERIRSEVLRRTGVGQIELENLSRVKGRTVLLTAGFAATAYFLISAVTHTDYRVGVGADWTWIPAILVASFATYVGAAIALMGSVPERPRLLPTVLAQLAGASITRVTTEKVGGMATNLRFLQRNGVTRRVAVAGLSAVAAGTVIVHVGMLILSVALMGRGPGDLDVAPLRTALIAGAVAVAALAVVAFFVPAGRRVLDESVLPTIRSAGDGVRQVASNPFSAVMLFGGAFVTIAGYVLALRFSLAVFGGDLDVFTVAVVFLTAQAIGQAAPTPGGVGAVEVALIAALAALGLPVPVAVPAVFLYRVATFWLPILPGRLAFGRLRSEGAL